MLLAFHNNPEIKEFYLNRVRRHRLQDDIIKGVYWENGKGCAIGCTLHAYKHSLYETELGIPQILAHLQDHVFEGLTSKDAKDFPERFLEAILVGADLSKVWSNFILWVLVDPECGIVNRATSGSNVEAIVRKVARFVEVGGTPEEGDQLIHEAFERDFDVSYHVALAVNEIAGKFFNEAASSFYLALASADEKWEKTNYKAQAEKLIELLKEAPVPATV